MGENIKCWTESDSGLQADGIWSTAARVLCRQHLGWGFIRVASLQVKFTIYWYRSYTQKSLLSRSDYLTRAQVLGISLPLRWIFRCVVREWSETHGDTVGTLVLRGVEQIIRFTSTAYVYAVSSSVLWYRQHVVVMISQLLHHLQRHHTHTHTR